jgi:hypothetical protein
LLQQFLYPCSKSFASCIRLLFSRIFRPCSRFRRIAPGIVPANQSLYKLEKQSGQESFRPTNPTETNKALCVSDTSPIHTRVCSSPLLVLHHELLLLRRRNRSPRSPQYVRHIRAAPHYVGEVLGHLLQLYVRELSSPSAGRYSSPSVRTIFRY